MSSGFSVNNRYWCSINILIVYLIYNRYFMRCDKTNRNRLGRGDVLNIFARGKLMLPRGWSSRGNIKFPWADIFNSHPAHRLLFVWWWIAGWNWDLRQPVLLTPLEGNVCWQLVVQSDWIISKTIISSRFVSRQVKRPWAIGLSEETAGCSPLRGRH